MHSLMPYLLLCLMAGLGPLLVGTSNAIQPTQAFPGWPTRFEGKSLMPLQLNEKERLFINDFPGKVRRFSDDHREYIVRWVTSSTRKLHPASDCLRGVGYRIKPMPIETRSDNNQWSVFLADRSGERLRVYERIYDNYGNSWTDVSAWYWAALLGKSRGPWWSVTIAEKDR